MLAVAASSALAATPAAAQQVPVRAFNVFFGLGIPAPLQSEGYDGVLEPLNEKTLNNLKALADVNPSAERVAEHIFKGIAPQLPPHVKLTRVTVTEASGCRASYTGATT